MRILLSTTSDISTILIKGQGKYLTGKGHHVIYSTCDGDKARSLSKEENLTFAPIPFSREIDVLNDLYCLFLACKILLKYKPDIVNAGTPKAGLIYMVASKIIGIKVRIFTLRGLRSSTLTGSKKKVVRFLEKISCSCATKVIAISPSLREEALQIKLTSENKIVVLSKGSSNGIDTKRFFIDDNLIKKSFLKKEELSLSSDVFVFGFIGRIVKDKGINELIDAFEQIRKEYKAKLLLVGDYEVDDPISKDYRKRIEENTDIIEIGYVDDIPLFAHLFDVLILPSYREGFGNVVIEAAMMGTPAIVSNIPGARDTVVDQYTGLLIEPLNSGSLYKAMKYYLQNKDILMQHGKAAQERAKGYFTSEIIWSKQEELYQSLKNNV